MSRNPLQSLLPRVCASALFLACSGENEEPPPPPAPTAVLIIDRPSLDFGEQEVGTSSAEQVFTLRNASPASVEAVSVTVDSEAFVITASTCERFLDAGHECEVRVKFAPGLAGSHTARLRAQGAPEGDEAVLQGTSFAYVDIRGLPAGASIVAGADAWSCGAPCKVPVRTAEVTLRATPAGYPRWGGACAAATRDCSLRMDGVKVVSLEEVASVVKWELPWARHPRAVRIAPGGDIVVQDDSAVTRLSSTGQQRWRLESLSPRGIGLDGAGGTYVLRSSGSITRLSEDGRELGTWQLPGTELSAEFIAVAPDGDVYCVVSTGNYERARQYTLYALTSQGTERWSRTFDEGQFNRPTGLGLDAMEAVYLSGFVYRRDGTSQGTTLEKTYLRKLSPEGPQLWEKLNVSSRLAVSRAGVTGLFSSTSGSAPGRFWVSMFDTQGNVQWTTDVGGHPGVVDTQTFTPTHVLLVGGHWDRASGDLPDKGWFAAMNLDTRAPGPVTYIEGPPESGARVTDLQLTPEGSVVVGGGFGPSYGNDAGFVRLYDGRVLTVGVSP
ncbi:choice-of-anchor D domain-containing protein [Pyxidicoccus fallax]|uniref:Choice-of-anchor D domain-containing protein n=1 Tax=Pyxidicoccus fallax TaxID=394095 RepID=A0A848LK56_9BACT|nr:choice-of-anchor D domain-containing protein [Pyxidicoccus fallax]NMO18082.1 choice-of-anchor D domain-containing protein [Pyxidicoccus fallax]NPC78588.1 choice-of-anchor D domain-containing protein [Pyxidicoccus fallax]